MALAPESQLSSVEALTAFAAQVGAACDETEAMRCSHPQSAHRGAGSAAHDQQPDHGNVFDGPRVPQDPVQLAHLPRGRAGHPPCRRQGATLHPPSTMD